MERLVIYYCICLFCAHLWTIDINISTEAKLANLIMYGCGPYER